MKRIVFLLILPLLLSGCYTTDQQFAGTLIGAHVGGTLGAAIFGADRSYSGAIFGDVVGTVAGAAIGSALTAPREVPERQVSTPVPETRVNRNYDASISQRKPSYRLEEVRNSASQALANLKVRNLRFIDANRNRIINPGEDCQLLFDIYNDGKVAVEDIAPCIYVVNENVRITMSDPEVIDHLEPGEHVHYVIQLKAEEQLPQTKLTFCIELLSPDGLAMPCREFDLQTAS